MLRNILETLGIAVLLLATIHNGLEAQGGYNNPLSRFGIGDLTDQNFIHLRSIGGLSGAFTDAYNINFINPATTANLRATAFDIGVSARNSTLKRGESSVNSWDGNLDYIAIAFPLNNPLNAIFDRKERKYKFSMGFGIQPVSQVAYDISSNQTDTILGDYVQTNSGDGGIYKLLWNGSVRYKDFSFGVNLGYNFGNFSYNRILDFSVDSRAFDTFFEDGYSLRGFTYDLGAHYTIVLNKNVKQEGIVSRVNTINIGVYGHPHINFTTKGRQFYRSESNFFISTAQDTLQFEEDIPGSGLLPGTIGFGAIYNHGTKFAIGFNYERNFWSNYENDFNKETLKNTNKLSFGAYLRPNVVSYRVVDRIYYRAGFYYQDDPRIIEDQSFDEIGFSLGLGIPFAFQRKISHINLNGTVGRRGDEALIKETFFKLGVSFNFNDDEWFRKRKYN